MRVITGTAKGMKLKVPKGLSVRPTTDRVKESLFNILRSKVADARVLDLFSGTGNLAIEALSRGAKEALLLDKSSTSIKSIHDNLVHTHLKDRAKIIQVDALVMLEKLGQEQRSYDLIFCDPPYCKGLVNQVLQCMNIYPDLLTQKGVLIIEHSRQEEVKPGRFFEIVRQETFGITLMSFVQKIEFQEG